MAIINPEWIIKQEGSFQTAEEMNTLAVAVKSNAIELQTDISNLQTHINNEQNPHSVTKEQVGLDKVDNVSDVNKPISTATQTALNGKVNNTGDETIAGVKTLSSSPIVPTPTTDMQASTKKYVDDAIINLTDDIQGNTTETIATLNTTLNSHTNDLTNPHKVTKTQIGLSHVDDTSDLEKPISTAVQTALNLKEDWSNKGAINGYAGLDETGKIPSTQLPSYVDDVLEYANLDSFPVFGESGKIYVALDTNKTYRWSGSTYIYITSGAVDSVAGKMGVVTLTKLDVGLNNVDNTSDSNKPVSTVQQMALDLKVNKTISIIAGSGLTNGGTLNADVTLDIASATDGILVNTDSIQLVPVNDLITVSTTKALSANQGKVLKDLIDTKTDKTITITAGNGLTGGGDLSINRTINIVSANDGITVNTDNILLNVINNLTSTSTTQPLSANQGKILNDTITSLTNLTKYAQQWYGIEWDITVSTSSCTRIGNMGLHNTLPIQSKMRRCLLKDDGMVNYYLSSVDSTKKEDGVTAAILDGTDGQVMVEIPEFYYKWESDGNKRRILISQYPIFSSKFNRTYVSAYEASLDRINNKLSSVVNTTTDYRGGNNTSTWDSLTSSLLGKPATNISLTNYRTYARNRGSVNWNCNTYNIQKIMYILYLIEYSNFNCQLSYNGSLDANGYHQGGLGDGVTNLDGTKWNNFNGYNPFIICGYTNSLGNTTNIIPFTMPFEYDSNGSINYIGVFNLSTTYLLNQYVSYNNLLYKCILESTGNSITDTSHFTQIIRTVTNVPSYRGIENPFGHVWKWTDGCKCNIQTDANGGNSLFYTCDNPTNYQDTNYLNYKISGLLVRSSGYIKQLISEEIMPSTIGGSSTTYMCDYFYTDVINNTGQRAVVFGGSASYGASAGFGSSSTYYAASYSLTYVGSRLCYILI